jgi:hypothetical protein
MLRLIPLSLIGTMAACGTIKTEPGAAPDTGGAADTDEPGPSDSGDPTDSGDPSSGAAWTDGPNLPDCEPQTGSSGFVALSGVVLTGDGPEAGHVVYSPVEGRILCAGASCDVSRDKVICTEGVISPGLINTHDHMQYNVLPPWQHDQLFDDRYDWRSDDDYWDYRTAYDAIEDDNGCDIMKWAELRSLVSGATSGVGSYGGSCIDVLIRNLDEDEGAHGIADYELYYSAGTVTDKYSPGDTLTPGSTYAAIENHVAEGVGGSVRTEIDHMVSVGMTGPGQIYVHATDATTEQLARMADEGTAIAWSPRSNLDLYGETTTADVAHRMGVPIMLGPDWTWSGSLNPAREMACANDYLRSRDSDINDVQIWRWTTSDAARVLELDGVIGSLDVGMLADIAVYAWSAQPYRAVIESGAQDVRLMIIGGTSLYGVPELMDGLPETPEWCENVSACGANRTLCVKAADSGDDSRTAAEIETTLSTAMSRVSMPSGLDYAAELLGLWMCEETRESCDIHVASDGDDDGDWTDDATDLCPVAFDPLQRDHDGDGVGDACDPCPLDPNSDVCSHTPGDVDGDGEPTSTDTCPYIANPAQTDRDADGKGDDCDLCPDEPNPGDEGCTFTVASLRDPSDPNHPSSGTSVTIHGLVVTAVYTDNGFFVQDPDATEYGAIYAYDRGTYTGVSGVEVGDVVSINGVYKEYYDLSEITDPTVTITDTTTPPAPIIVPDPCTIATDGANTERYESMLVQVVNATVTSANPDSPDDYGEFELADCLRVDDLLTDVMVPQPEAGRVFSGVTGVLNYSYGQNKLTPRGADDIAD